MKTLFMVVIVVTAAVAALLLKSRHSGVANRLATRNPSALGDFPPQPKWKPSIPVDLDKIAATFRYYSNGKTYFAVFQNGTCVPVKADSEQQEQDALAVMHELFHRHPDFNPLSMDDGNWMVSYSDAAYSICFADEVETNWETIDKNHLDALATAEVLLNVDHKPNVFDKRGKIGLFGRARWFMDCENPKVVRIEKPGSQQAAGN